MAKLHFIYGTMNSGKTATLIQAWYNYQERGMQALILKPIIDDRDPVGQRQVRSRTGVAAPAIAISPNDDLFNVVCTALSHQTYRCVMIDEAQFLTPSQVEELAMIVDNIHIPVMAYGLRVDFQSQLFPGSARLLALADRLEEQRTICHCGKKATHVLRLDDDGCVVTDGDQVLTGGNDRYVSVCRRDWNLKNIGTP